MTWLFVFVVMCLTDLIWAEYIKAINATQAVRSAWLAVLVVVGGAFVTIEYVNNPWLLLPAGLGAALGTYISVSRSSA